MGEACYEMGKYKEALDFYEKAADFGLKKTNELLEEIFNE